MAVRVVEQEPRGRFLVDIAGAEVIVDTNAESLDEVLGEMIRNMNTHGRRFQHIIAGLRYTPAGFDDDPHSAYIFQLCIGRRCILVPLFRNHELPVSQSICLRFPFLLIVGADGTGPWDPIFDGAHVRLYDWWCREAAWRPGEVTLDSIAARLLGEVIVMMRPVMGEEDTMTVWEQWPPTNARLANLCMDAYLLREIGTRLFP